MNTSPAKIQGLLALDVGEKRVGVAMTNTFTRLPSPLATLLRDDNFWKKLENVIDENDVNIIIVGLPRNLRGDETKQTIQTRTFIKEIKSKFKVNVIEQDEALTSVNAEKELKARGKPFAKEDIDSLAATYILEDYLNSQKGS